MKILPVSNQKQSIIKPCAQIQNPPATQNFSDSLPVAYYKPISFGSMVNPEFENELKSLHDIRCPVCGAKMLPSEDLQYLGLEIAKVETPEEFLNVLKTHEDSVPIFGKRLIRKSEEILQKMPDIDAMNFVNILSGEASQKINFALRDSILLIEEKQKEKIFSDSDEVLADECKMRLAELKNKRDKRKVVPEVKKILSETVSMMESPAKWGIYESIKTEMIKRSKYKSLFRYELPVADKRLNILLTKVFSSSEIHLRKVVEKLPFEQDKNFNIIMLCNGCDNDKSAFARALFEKTAQSNENFTAYLSDITKEIVRGNITLNKLYPIELNGMLKKISGEKMSPEAEEKMRMDIKVKTLRDFHEEIDFKPVSIPGTPCACCGITTITHEEKCNFMEKIKKARDLKAVVSVMRNADEFIHEKYKPLIKILEDGIAENLSEREILFQMRLYEQKNLNNALGNACDKLEKIARQRRFPAYYSTYINEFKELVKTKYYNHDYLKAFPYEEYKNDVKDLVRKFYQYDEKRMRSILKEPVRDAFSEQMLLFPLASISYKVGSALKCIMQDILKRSLATIDHLQPQNKGGSNEMENLTVMCYDCNQRKSDYEFPVWLKIAPMMKHNYKKYYNKIDELIAQGQLNGYENYLSKQKKYIKELTGWTVNVQMKSDYGFKSDSTWRL